MAEEQKNEEEETLNPEQEVETETSEDTSKVYSAEEVAELLEAEKKKLSSASEKGVQKLISQNKNYTKALNAMSQIADDNSYLIELADTQPEVAEIILNDFYKMSLDDYKEEVGYQEDLTDPKVLERKAEKLANKKIQEQTIQNKTNSFIEKLKMSKEEEKEFLDVFNERKQLKSFNVNEVDKHLEKAYKEIADDEAIKKLKQIETIGKTIATGEGKTAVGNKKTSKDDMNAGIDAFMKRNKLIK